MKYKRLLITAGGILMALLAYFLRDVVNERLVIPLSYLWWRLGLYYHAIEEETWLVLAVMGISIIAYISIADDGLSSSEAGGNGKSPAQGPVEELTIWLALFTKELPDKYFEHTEVITRDGIMGNYVHGNEPSHHVPYLYNYTDRPWMTGKRVRDVLDQMYAPKPDGLSGNDDCGQMSAWCIFSSLGFYPMCPGSDAYELGAPVVDRAEIPLPNWKTFIVTTKGQGPKNVYVRSVKLNGRVLDGRMLRHDDLMSGATLEFNLSSERPR